MKILFNTYPMAFHTPGGGEIQLLAYRKYLSELGVDVRLFDQWDPQFLAYDLVHFFSCIGGSVHFCGFVKKLGLPLVISSSLWITEQTKHLYPIEEIRAQLAFSDKVIANSNIECEKLSTIFNLPREKFITVYNGVSELFFKPVSPEIFRKHYKIDAPFVLNVANIEPRKNQLTLVRAMKAFPEMKLVLIGHTRDVEYAKKVFFEGGDNVIYAGPVNHEDELLRSAYAACGVFCLPSTLETPGLAALEAFAVGAPLVVTKEGSAEEYFGKDAIYIDYKMPDQISIGISEALNKKLYKKNENLRSNKIIGWTSISEELRNIYQVLIKSG